MNNVKQQLRRCLVCHPRHGLKSRPPLIPTVALLHTHGSLHTFSPSSFLPLLYPLVPALTLPSDKIKGPSEAAWDSGFILFVLCAQWGPVREKSVFFLCTAGPRGPVKNLRFTQRHMTEISPSLHFIFRIFNYMLSNLCCLRLLKARCVIF